MQVLKFPTKKLNKKKLFIFGTIIFTLFLILICSIIYNFNSSFRKFIDVYILNKEISSDKLPVIELPSEDDQFFYAYDKYITILNKKILYTYNHLGHIIFQNDIDINSPLFVIPIICPSKKTMF